MFSLTGIKLGIEKEKNKNGVTFLELRRLWKRISRLFHNVFTKRSQGQGCKLEMLFSKWNADNGDTKHNTENQMGETNPNTP